MLVKLPVFLREERYMTKLEFLESLEKQLSDIPYVERREALDYYNNYFDDADCTEEEVVKTLGTAEEVARSIREDLSERNIVVYEEEVKTEQATNKATKTEKKKTKLEGWQWALIIVAAVATFPVWISIVAGVGGTLFGIVAAFFGIVIALLGVAIGFAAAAVALIGVGFSQMVITPLGGTFCIGLGILLLGLAMLSTLAFIKIITILIPTIWKGLATLWNTLFKRKECIA